MKSIFCSFKNTCFIVGVKNDNARFNERMIIIIHRTTTSLIMSIEKIKTCTLNAIPNSIYHCYKVYGLSSPYSLAKISKTETFPLKLDYYLKRRFSRERGGGGSNISHVWVIFFNKSDWTIYLPVNKQNFRHRSKDEVINRSI